jgi:hypothetical protein
MKIIEEKVVSKFAGTIIDLETIGEFDRRFNDSRQYSLQKPVFFGYITQEGLNIICAEELSETSKLFSQVKELLPKLEKPLHSFNTHFEMGVLFHNLGEKILFERELNKEKYEAKKSAVKELKLDNYDDPFNDVGYLFIENWKNKNMKDCIAHNRADLLKEKDILLKRGFRSSDKFYFVL